MTTLRPEATAALIRDARVRAGLRQQDLARRLRTTQSAISRWERGHDEPRLSSLRQILHACGLTAELVVRPAVEVDRAQIRQQRAMTPEQRLASVSNLSRFVAGARRA